MRHALQFYVEDDQFRALEAWRRKRGWSKSQALRAALRALTAAPGEDRLLALSGMVQGLPPDASQRFDRYLQESFVAETRARYRPGKARRLR